VKPADDTSVERHYAAWYAFHACVAGVEVHPEPALTWMRLPVPGWANGGVGLDCAPEDAADVLGSVDRAFDGGGLGFWIGPLAPDTTEAALRSLSYRCRKRFPAFVCHVGDVSQAVDVEGVELATIEDHAVFGPRQPHPAIGPVTTDIRRFQIRRRAALVGDPNGRVIEIGARHEGRWVGACLVFFDPEGDMASVHDLGVPESERNRGIGRALVTAAVHEAQRRGCSRVCLISTAMGERVYRRVGFVEVTRIAYWYRGQG
jgi:GNAT superfamily N-acetyltransferase